MKGAWRMDRKDGGQRKEREEGRDKWTVEQQCTFKHTKMQHACFSLCTHFDRVHYKADTFKKIPFLSDLAFSPHSASGFHPRAFPAFLHSERIENGGLAF